MINAIQMIAAAAFAPRKRLFWVLPSETSRGDERSIFGRKKAPVELL